MLGNRWGRHSEGLYECTTRMKPAIPLFRKARKFTQQSQMPNTLNPRSKMGPEGTKQERLSKSNPHGGQLIALLSFQNQHGARRKGSSDSWNSEFRALSI